MTALRLDVEQLSWLEINALLAAVVVPRPIAWVASRGESGGRDTFNLAPFSSFAPVCNSPPMVTFSIGRRRGGQRKDTAVNILSTREFVINIPTSQLVGRLAATACDYPHGVDEFAIAGVTPVMGAAVRVPRVAECSSSLECVLHQHIELGDDAERGADLIIGRVVCAWVDSDSGRGEWGATEARIDGVVGALAVERYLVDGRVICVPNPVEEVGRW